MSLQAATTHAPPARWLMAWQPWVISVSVAIIYFLAARLSLVLLDEADGVAVFWPAAGIATGFLLAFGTASGGRW